MNQMQVAGQRAARTIGRVWQCRLVKLEAIVVFALVAALPAAALAAADELPARAGRIADVAGELFLSPADQPDAWTPITPNYPVVAGDNVWSGRDSRTEIDIGAGQFRLGADTSLQLARLDERQFAIFIAEGKVSVRVRVLDPGETAQVDTPNAQIVLTRPGLYRIEVSPDRQRTLLAVREGEAKLQTGDAVVQVLPGQSASAAGAQPLLAFVVNGIGGDAFDMWVTSRERYYDRSRANSYVSRQMVGWADLEEYGSWEQQPEYGAIWYPSNVAADWAPYRDGYWTEAGIWGTAWVDSAPWGYAPFHYGRWAHVHGRWGWCPGAYVARPAWAPALVGWAGGSGWTVSASHGSPVYGWVPLGWGEAYRPAWRGCTRGCWERYNRPYAVDGTQRPTAPPSRYVNATAPGGLTAIAGTLLRTRTLVRDNLVNVPGGAVAGAPLLAAGPAVRPEPGRIPGGRTPGQGAPAPASTFYPVLARPGLLPGGPDSARVPPWRPSLPGATDEPTRAARPVPTPAPAAAVNAGGPGKNAAGAPVNRPAATGTGSNVRYPVPPPGASIYRTAPTAGPLPSPAAPTLSAGVTAPSVATVTAPPVARPVTRSPGAVPPSPGGQVMMRPPGAPSVQLTRPVAAPVTLVRPSPAAVPMVTPMPVPVPVRVAPSGPAGNDTGSTRTRSGGSAAGIAPIPERPRQP